MGDIVGNLCQIWGNFNDRRAEAMAALLLLGKDCSIATHMYYSSFLCQPTEIH